MAFFPELRYDAPKINTPFEVAGQLAQLQQAQNQNKLAQRQFQEADRADAEHNALAGIYQGAFVDGKLDPNKVISGLAQNRLGANIPAYLKQQNEAEASGVDLSNKRLTGQKTQNEITQQQRERAAARLGAHINDPELTAEKIFADLQSQVQSGELTLEQAQAMAQRIPQDPAQLKPFLSQILMGVMSPKEQIDSGNKERDFRLKSANEPFKHDGSPNTSFQKFSIQKATAGATIRANTPQQIKLSPGERFTPDGNVEAIPGSSQYVKQSGLHAKDYQAKINIDTKTDQAIKKIDAILDKANEGAFNSNFGGYSAYATKLLPGATQDIGRKIESLKSDMKVAGLEMIRAGGSIGAMTEREWPIVQNMIDTIDPRMGEKAARDAFENIKTYLTQIKTNAAQVYDTEWSGSPFANKAGNTPPGHKSASAYLSGAKDQADFASRVRALKAKGWTDQQIRAANGQ